MRSFVRFEEKTKEIKRFDSKRTYICICPKFFVSGKDLMKKGDKFYAILDRDTGMWSTDEGKVVEIVDREMMRFIDKHYIHVEGDKYTNGQNPVIPELMDDSSTKWLKEFKSWLTSLPPNHNYVQLDTELTQRDETVVPEMYRSKRLDYEIKPGPIDSYEKLMSTLYSDDDRQKIEWCIGSVYTGASKKIEKILVLYGKPGSGKSTILDLVKSLFEGYWVAFVASELVSKAHQFSTAPFKDNPLLAIQDDGDMARIDSPVINEIVSHKDVMINEKGKQQYSIKSNAFLFLATNKTVDIQDRRMGMARRLLDVYPSGRKLPEEEYDALVSRLKFEKGAIAAHCIEVFKRLGKNYYTNYIPEKMIDATSPVQNFLCDSMERITARPYWSRSQLYKMFKDYCEDSGISYPMRMTEFGEQLKDYFEESYKFKRFGTEDIHNAFVGFKTKMVLGFDDKEKHDDGETGWLKFDALESVYDKLYFDRPAQYSKEDGSPKNKWINVKTKLKDLDTNKLHWVMLPANVVRIDFDLKDSDGNKNLELNIKAASKFPPTYAEVSKSGGGVHLYYIWDGDVEKLSNYYDENIEIKKPNQPDRRILTKCNSLTVTTISTGLPFKEEKPKFDNFKITESSIRTTIKRCLAKEVHQDTTSNVDMIYKVLEDAYISNCSYDVSDMRDDILDFARNSTNQSAKCVKKVETMKFVSADCKIVSKGGELMIDADKVEFENAVRNYIREKLYYGKKNARETVNTITGFLDRIYNSDMSYDVEDMRQTILIFGVDNGGSDKERDYCTSKISEMKFSSADMQIKVDDPDEAPIVFFDCEVFPNLIVICWKYAGPEHKVMQLINPTPGAVDNLCKTRLIGFNNKEYDNHILYAIKAGYSTKEIYNISKGVINREANATFREAKNLSYTDIYDFSSKKQSLKDWEIEIGIHHQELGFPWDEPVDPKYWDTVAKYCENDVMATEALFNHLKQDWMARQILADLADSNVNESTNNLTLKIVFGNNRRPTLVYTDLATGIQTEGR